MKYYSNNVYELNNLCAMTKSRGQIICFQDDLTGATKSKKDGFAKYIIDNMIRNGELNINDKIVTSGFENFTLAVGDYLRKLGWTAEFYAISHPVNQLYQFNQVADKYENLVPIVVEYQGTYPKEFCKNFAQENGAVFIDQYSSEYGIEYYEQKATDCIVPVLHRNSIVPDVFINPNATGATTKGIGTALRSVFGDLKILCPSFISGGNPNLGADITPELLADFKFDYFDRCDVLNFVDGPLIKAEGLTLPKSWKQVNFALTYLYEHPNSTVFLYIGG